MYNVGSGSIKFFHYVINVINLASSLTASFSSYCALPREMLHKTKVGYEQKSRANFGPLPLSYICLLGKVSLQDDFIEHKSDCLAVCQWVWLFSKSILITRLNHLNTDTHNNIWLILTWRIFSYLIASIYS